MTQTAFFQQDLKQDLKTTLSQVIATRPEWRFLEQQRHLQDVLKLLASQLLSHHQMATQDQWSNEDNKRKALTLSWITLLLSQELQHPPQLTKDNFINVFYICLTDNKKTLTLDDILDNTNAELNTLATVRRQSFCVSSNTHDTLRIQEQIYRMADHIYRIQATYIGWNQPSFHIKFFLGFLNHTIPDRWIQRFTELLQLLEQHDSLLSFIERKPEFTKSNLHASHPLKKQALEQIAAKRRFYHKLNENIESHFDALASLLAKLSQEKPGLQKITAAVSHMQQAWKSTPILSNNVENTLEFQVCLFEEAEYQRSSLMQILEKPLAFLNEKKPQLSQADQNLISKVIQLFEVNYERSSR